MLIIAAAAFSLTASAQVKLNDKNADAYNVGYGVEISDFLSTASATTITGEELQQTSATNLAQALYGRLPGLTALSNGGFSGDENKGASFNIRGYHTLNDKSILILVDGYERPIDRLSVEEVESVTVLKDAAATALLGHEGINGAILVKTKRGAKGKTHVKADYSHKFQFSPAPLLFCRDIHQTAGIGIHILFHLHQASAQSSDLVPGSDPQRFRLLTAVL